MSVCLSDLSFGLSFKSRFGLSVCRSVCQNICRWVGQTFFRSVGLFICRIGTRVGRTIYTISVNIYIQYIMHLSRSPGMKKKLGAVQLSNDALNDQLWPSLVCHFSVILYWHPPPLWQKQITLDLSAKIWNMLGPDVSFTTSKILMI